MEFYLFGHSRDEHALTFGYAHFISTVVAYFQGAFYAGECRESAMGGIECALAVGGDPVYTEVVAFHKFLHSVYIITGLGFIVGIYGVVYGIFSQIHMKFAGFAGLGVNASVVVYAVCYVGCFLYLDQKITSADTVYTTCGEEIYLAGM